MARSDRFARELEEAKERSVGQLLLQAARLWNERAVRLARQQNPSLRLAHTRLLPHIDLEGTKLTDLAARVGASKQAVGELVDSLEAQGLLERVPDPSDRRAKLVRYTPKGRRSLLAGLELLGGIEREVEQELGERRVRALRQTLARLVELLE